MDLETIEDALFTLADVSEALEKAINELKSISVDVELLKADGAMLASLDIDAVWARLAELQEAIDEAVEDIEGETDAF